MQTATISAAGQDQQMRMDCEAGNAAGLLHENASLGTAALAASGFYIAAGVKHGLEAGAMFASLFFYMERCFILLQAYKFDHTMAGQRIPKT